MDAMIQAVQPLLDLLEKFGFPTVVASWALWRMDKFFARGDSFQASLDNLEESVSELQTLLQKNTEIQAELATTMRLLIMMTRNLHGGDNDDR